MGHFVGTVSCGAGQPSCRAVMSGWEHLLNIQFSVECGVICTSAQFSFGLLNLMFFLFLPEVLRLFVLQQDFPWHKLTVKPKSEKSTCFDSLPSYEQCWFYKWEEILSAGWASLGEVFGRAGQGAVNFCDITVLEWEKKAHAFFLPLGKAAILVVFFFF